MKIQRIAVVGAGVIGASWTAFYLSKGFDVAVTDPAPGARERLDAALANFLGERAGTLASRVAFEPTLDAALEGADFVQENGPEHLDFKRELYRRIDARLPAHVLVASSSSGLKMSDIQTACDAHPQRCLVAHPFNPPHLIPLVELVGGAATSADAIARAKRFYDSLGKVTIVLNKERAGHVANRLAAALFREVYYLVGEGVVSVEDADKAVSWGPGLRWGLMGQSLVYHLGGGEGGIAHFLEHLSGPMASWWNDLGAPSFSPDVDRQLIDALREIQGAHSMRELGAERDRLLVELIDARRNSFLP
ncbi:3-hydroxyacyl-CoA dehydrogenase NAD-binding domain-containing protein [Burkholderia pseudomallei]|uniref:3-hydroxyacyl-CoA dehydrogenase NAD-binding domain-containing protein n=1 Tax=Burkholderia pseudomallei TaxID=28450 RepID=UPI0002D2847A|nr:3-hydroxyacyl-CoA dehydrogenase NAD-binding domain-containing protein [Burkholderia pseudomallei]AGR71558.1 3-hydroxyacyl-CoA dehydrogenase, NAD binding domain protein [Burkholderia pseudomallei MSHR305]AHK66552.1 3-hydroxyacyl-CoA dehydrogenase, NAD binding domain protein [Burkholderia pseudomallei MSHR520]AIP79051.1 3-hydroxyacyl-CoA dehydrogenase, NAD binding domain protein [Burkholderia pseudomallei]APZ17289.1 3-hydroxyacyl-CoA dehydrogenase [Burkholderia pseudomallei]APZ23484.1 3-hydro